MFYLFCYLVNRRLQSRDHSGAIGGRIRTKFTEELPERSSKGYYRNAGVTE